MIIFVGLPEDKKRWRGYPGERAFVARLGLFGYRHYPFWKFGSLSKLFARIGGRPAGSPIPSAQIGTSCSPQARACALRGSSVNVTMSGVRNISMVTVTPWVVSTNGSSQALTCSQPVLAARSYMSFLWIIYYLTKLSRIEGLTINWGLQLKLCHLI